MAISSAKAILKAGTTEESLVKLVDIKEFPDLGSAPDLLETTTLSAEKFHTYIQGLQAMDGLEFTYNYTAADFKTVNDMAGDKLYYEIEFKDGDEGGFKWQGEHSTWVSGAGVDDVVEAIIQIAPSTEIEFIEAN